MKILLFTSFMTIANCAQAQVKDNSIKYSDFNIDEKIVKLIKKLELSFNRKVSIKIYELQPGHHGSGEIKGDSIVIELDKNFPNKNELLLHELLHFEIKLLGVPNAIGWAFPDNDSRTRNELYLSWIKGQIWDKIHHRYFYPIMVTEYGYDPYLAAKTEIIELLKSNEIPGLSEATKSIALACKMLHVYIETNDETYLKEFENFLNVNFNGVGVKTGNKLIEMFKSNDFTSVETFPSLFVECFNFCMKKVK